MIRHRTGSVLGSVALALSSAIVLLLSVPGGAAAVVHPGGYQTVFNSVTVADHQTGAVTAHCPTGQLLVTGGAYWHIANGNGDISLNAYLESSAPTADATGWFATGRNSSGQSLDLTAVAQCLSKTSVGKYSVKSREVTVDPGRSGNADLRCSAGQSAVIGGVVWHKPGKAPKATLDAAVNTSFPDGGAAGWSASGFNLSTAPLQLRVILLCLPYANLGASYTAKARALPNGTVAVETYLACDGGTLAVGGGVSWAPASNPYDYYMEFRNWILNSTPTGDGTAWYAATSPGDFLNDVIPTVHVLCLRI